MVYNPVIIFLPLQGDGMVGKITRRLTGGKNTVSLILTVGKKQKKNPTTIAKKTPPVWRKLRVTDNAGERSRNKANTWFWKLNYALRD